MSEPKKWRHPDLDDLEVSMGLRPSSALAEATTVCPTCRRSLTVYAYTADDLARLDDFALELATEHTKNCRVAGDAS